MGNIKQRYLKASRDMPFAEAVKVKATAKVWTDQIVYVDGSAGPYLSVSVADADLAIASSGRLMIAKHTIEAGKYGICVPWKLSKTLSTVSAAVGDPVFLSDAPTTAVSGNLSLTAPTGDAKVIIVGRVTVAATIANGGAILLKASAPENIQAGRGTLTGTNTLVVGRPTESIAWVIGAATEVTLTILNAITITNVAVTAGGSTGVNVNVYNGAASGGNKICTQMATGGSVDVRTNAAGIHVSTGKNAVAAGGTIRCTKSGTGDALDTVVLTFIRT